MSIPSMYSGLSGLSAHQRMLDLVGHNIANVNTKGYKRYTLRITESSGPLVRPALTPTSERGGLNPLQFGYGAKVGNTSVENSQGNLEPTGRALDLGIEGEGFFTVSDSENKYYTRVGNFAIDSDNNLVDQATGYFVQSPEGNIVIDSDSPIAPTPTTTIDFKGNLDPSTPVIAVGDWDPTNIPSESAVKSSIKLWDERGESRTLDLTFARRNDGTNDVWTMVATLPNSDGSFVGGDNIVTNLEFNDDGSFEQIDATAAAPGNDNEITIDWDGLTTNQTFTLNFGTGGGSFDGLTNVGGDSTASAIDQDGFGSGSLVSTAVNPDGAIVGQYSNGQLKEIAQLQIATFSNPNGLEKASDGLYTPSGNTGLPIFGKGLSGRAGSIVSGVLEASNVDISSEISLMIVAQRGFQVNARSITVSNQVLEEISNLTR